MRPLTFLVLSTTDWDAPQFGSRQQVARELARRGHRVLFVEVPRAIHSFISDPAGTRRALRRIGHIRPVTDRLFAYTPFPVLPIYYHPLVNRLNQRLMVSYLSRALNALQWQPDVLWTYWPHTADLIGRLGERVAVYHCIDDFAAAGYPLTPRGAVQRMEAEQCRRVDLIFARSEQLTAEKRLLNPHTVFLPGGVDTTAFDPTRIGPPPTAVASLPRPRAGLVGTLDDRLDVTLLTECARALPNVTFVLVGPIRRHRVDLNPLRALPNVHILPPCPHTEVPAIVAALDVCLIPYRLNQYTEALSPIKLYECLALGKPIVSTDLPYVRQEAGYVRLARSTAEFRELLQDALNYPPTPAERAKWRAVACKRSWARQVDEIERHLTSFLDRLPHLCEKSSGKTHC